VWSVVDDDRLLDEARAIAARAASAPHKLVRRLKSTLQTMASVSEHEQAVALELEAQLWSLEQPVFAERLAALLRRLARR
jgi:enoyl-CoA hydratase